MVAMIGIRYMLALALLLQIGCTYTEKVRDGRAAYERKQYAVAISLLESEIQSGKGSGQQMAERAYLLALSHQKLHDFPQSLLWFDRAYKAGYGPEALVSYARTLTQMERYEEAMTAFQKAGDEQGEPLRYRADISTARVAAEWAAGKEASPYKVNRTGINTSYGEYAPFPYEPGRLLFTSDRPQSMGTEVYKWTGNKYSSIFVSDVRSGDVQRFDRGFNSLVNDGTLVFSPNRQWAAFTRCDPDESPDVYCKIYLSMWDGVDWSTPEMAEFTLSETNYSYPAFSSDGRLLLFSSNQMTGQGGYDIYVSELVNGYWEDPAPISGMINTSYDEISPYMDSDTLYFASNKPGGMGGLDIYRTYLQLNGQWIPPQNMMAPVNSGGDDYGFVVDRLTPPGEGLSEQGYFTSNRMGGAGNDDIYAYEKRVQKPPPVEEKDSLQVVQRIRVNLVTQEKEFVVPDDPNSGIRFRKPLGLVEVNVSLGDSVIATQKTDRIGGMTLSLEAGREYVFVGSYPDYISNKTVVSTLRIPADQSVDTLIEARLLLEKIYYNKEIVLDNIYYDYDRWEIRQDARPALDELADLLRINPGLKIQLASHTDCRGTEEYNQELSQKRAESVLDYLSQAGITRSRLVARGFGESQPAAPCVCERCSEAEHQLNRRTTFAILEQ